MSNRLNRRDLIKLSPAGVAALGAAMSARAEAPSGAIAVRVTAGAQRYAEAPALVWGDERAASTEAIVVDPKRSYQELLGFGAAFTDAACQNLRQMPEETRGV